MALRLYRVAAATQGLRPRDIDKLDIDDVHRLRQPVPEPLSIDDVDTFARDIGDPNRERWE